MSDPGAEPGSPEPAEPDGGTGTGTGGSARYSVPQAAARLGITQRAVRKRISAGTLRAERDGAAWVVFLEGGSAEPEPRNRNRQFRAEPERGTGAEPSVPCGTDAGLELEVAELRAAIAGRDALVAHLEADRDRWRAQAERLTGLLEADRMLQLQAGAVDDDGPAEHAPQAPVEAQDAPIGPTVGDDTSQPSRAARALRRLRDGARSLLSP